MPLSIQIKQLSGQEDLKACFEIRKQVFVEEQHVPREQEIDAFEKDSIHFLALFNGKPAAAGRLRIDGRLIKFERICTLKEMRGKGIGKKLISEMQSAAQQKFPKYLQTMYAQCDAIPFYEKLGWIAIGPVFQEAKIDHRVMVFH